MLNTIKNTGMIIGIAFSVFFVSFIVFAWTSPPGVPPICPAGEPGCETPLHTGTAGQSKTGGLLLNTGGASTGLIVEHGNVGIGTLTPSVKLDVKGGGIRINPDGVAKPTCDASTRGVMWTEYGSTGEGDQTIVCNKTPAETYEWTEVASKRIIQASGGNEVYDFVADGTNGVLGQKYRVHKFTSVGQFNFAIDYAPGGIAEVEYLIVAGGGGGATDAEIGGGGGGGGLLTGTLNATTQSYVVVVGAGGARGSGPDESGAGTGTNGGDGGNSVFGAMIAIGGGGGGTRWSNGRAGGSGGGAGDGTRSGGAGTTGQGYAGGNSNAMNSPSAFLDSGAGGGAGGAANLYVPGPGLYNSITQTTLAAGGTVVGYGGKVQGAPNTGNGGSGTRAGGSGIVVIRYKI
jgi:hypothetical protein